MRFHFIPRLVGGAVLAAALLAAPAFTFAGSSLPQGAVAPDFEGKEFVNTEEITLKDLRGKVVYYDIFRTT